MAAADTGPWRWFGLDRPVDVWAAGRDADEVAAVHELLFRIAGAPLDALPGRALPGAPSSLFRFVDDGSTRVVFLVTRPIVVDGLRLIAITSQE